MVFGVDDVLEGVTLTEIAVWLGTTLFGEATAAASTEGTALVIQDLLGEEGLEAIIDVAKNETTSLLANEINVPVFNQVGVQLWEEEGLQETANMSQNGFIDRVKLIGNKLQQAGVNMLSPQGKELLTTIVKRGLEIGKKGVENVLDPKVIIGGVAGGLGVRGAIKAFQKKSGREFGKFIKPPTKIENDDPLIANLPKF